VISTPADRPVAVVTGASSGIGAATASTLTEAGFDVVLGARRMDRLEQVAASVGGRALPLDVTDTASVEAFAGAITELTPSVALLVNNAGGALGMTSVEQADEEQWRWMYDANVLGVMRVTRALLPALRTDAAGHIVIVGSIAGVETYPGGGGYTAAKHATHAVSQTLRRELLEDGIRVTEVAPGLVDTEFSMVRLGDQEAADRVYTGLTPLSAEDVAEVIGFAATRPAHVCLDYITVKPTAQASATVTHRRS
jgi:NADP-dependent 3-hydroxy acid dehydrogenase YdfG